MTLDEVLEQLIATCPCDACGRYRRLYVATAFAVKRSLEKGRRK